MTSIRVTDQPAPVNLSGGASVRNDGSFTIYYRDETPVSSTANDGSIAAGSSTTLSGTQWFATAAATQIGYMSVPTVSPSSSGTGLPAGGTAGQLLAKNSSTDGDAGWTTSSAGGPTVTGTTANLGASATVAYASSPAEQWLGGTLNANLAITTTSPVAGSRLVLLAAQDATGGRTVSIDGNNIPVPSAASAVVIVVARWVDGTTFKYESASANPMTAAGDMIIGGVNGALTRLAGVANKTLQTDGSGVPFWATTAAGGGGDVMPLVAGKQYMPPIVVGGTNISAANGIVKAAPFYPGRSTTIDISKIHVNTAATAGGVYRVAVYDDNAGIPGNLIDESSGTDVITGTGIVTITGLSAAVTSGSRFWLLGVQQGAPATPATFKGQNGAGATDPAIMADTSNLGNGDCLQWTTSVTGAYPGTGGLASTWNAGSGRPAISIGSST